MKPLTRGDLMSLEDYSEQRRSFRSSVLEHERNRRVQVGPNATLVFQDRLTIRYKIQEVLNTKNIYDTSEIEQILDTYNPLIPDGRNWKASLMVDFPDVEERQIGLIRLSGIEDRVWIGAGDNDRTWAIADEYLGRSNEESTSAVHNLRFELDESFVDAIKSGSDISVGIRHDFYNYSITPISDNLRCSILEDLD